MTRSADLLRLVPDAPDSLLDMLDGARGAVEAPNRSEIFGPERFAQHGRSLAETHRAELAGRRSQAFFPRLAENIAVLREAQQYIGAQAATGYHVSPAAEWLLDNFHLIEAQLKEIHDGLPRRYFRRLPVLIDEPLAGLPRVYGVAWAFVAHADGAFDEELLTTYLAAYQQVRALTLGELWALPTTLRVVLVENLRRLAERLATNKAARELANLVGDRLETYSLERLDALLALLERRGVGRIFLLQLAQRLQDHQATGLTGYHDWLLGRLPDLAAAQVQQPAEQAADNLSVSNAIGSLRLIGNADWAEIVEHTSATMQMLLAAPAFEAERSDTRDDTLHAIEALARQSGRGETEVAQVLLELMRSGGDACAAAHWLHGGGRAEFAHRLGLSEPSVRAWRSLRRRAALPAYLAVLAGGSVALVAWVLGHGAALPAGSGWLAAIGALLMLFPASEAVVAVINRLISESARPSRLPRLALAQGIPPEHRVMVVIPGMLTSRAVADELTRRLELHHLANPERHAQFALLTDWADAETPTLASDRPLLDATVRQIAALNARYANGVAQAPRFVVLHRARTFSASEGRYIGWERKRGKLEQLVALLAEPPAADAAPGPFIDLGEWSRVEAGTRYIVTLDGDTQLPPGRLRELVGVAAHPNNTPIVDPATRTVTHGYGILQPRVVTPLPAPQDITLYHWLFAGQCGIDPYSAASSEVYQDVFREGTFAGKGLVHVDAMHAVLARRLPDDAVLSHDLLEGSLARCAAVTDISVIEDAPFHADVAASRVHRWTRGDWQLLPFLLQPRRYRLRAINRWKMLDNLRRSLVAPMSLALLVFALATDAVAPGAALLLVFAALSAGPLMGAVAGFAPSRDGIAKRHFYHQACAELERAVCSGAWLLAQLLQLALLNLDAVLRALWRLLVSRRHLLEWTTAAAAQASASTQWRDVLRRHRLLPVAALALWGALRLVGTPWPVLATLLCVVWGASPLWTWWVSRARPPHRDAALPEADRAYLEDAGRDTWRLFERCVGADDNHLPPDNLQLTPQAMVAHRTSPTNIGLYLLSAMCARRFGWIGTHELLDRLEATLATLAELPRHRGHFLNWYDTQRKAALLPMYVSTVDSGNLSGHLLAVAQACTELARAPYDSAPARRAIAASAARLAPQLGAGDAPADGALAKLLALADPLADAAERPEWLDGLLRNATDELAARATDDVAALAPTPADEFAWCATDHLATLRGALADAQAARAESLDATQRERVALEHGAMRRLHALAIRCEALAWEADFAFLYHRKRRLFHIGFRVGEQQLDTSFYDLLASESRLTSLLAIAKGDVPVNHWAALGRPFYAVGTRAGLRSWSGSMFEYLMPTLVLDEPHGSVLRDATEAAVQEQVAFGREQHVPWGISESAYAASDHTLAYQYAPQGVPRLALRRTPTDELVIAPYATALAAQIAPHLAVRNLARIDALTPRSRYGFIEALDYSAGRQSGAQAFTRVDTFMAHHQGMSIVAIANLLHDGTARRWAMANPHLEAVASLLHERAPREVPVLLAPPPLPSSDARQRRVPGLLRELVPGAGAIAPTHLLSNGRYAVALRPNGAGWSRWGHIGVSRWRDDALRDAHGSFFYLRWDRQPQAVSLTQHPAPDPAARYSSCFHADRVSFDATWSELAARTTVWVGPEDDIEFREVELRNLGERTLEVELLSAFEITLAAPSADEAHPAFSNLFLRGAWQPAQQALRFERKPRLPTEPVVHAAHFLAHSDTAATDVRVLVDRLGWLGRNRDPSQPLAEFPPAPGASGQTDESALDTGLDPVCALSVRLRLAPLGKATLTFCTSAGDRRATLDAVIDKHRQRGPVARASLMSATLNGIHLRELGVNAENFAAIQTLTSAIVTTLARPHLHDAPGLGDETAFDRKLLWRFGISGDRPIVLVSAGAPQGMGLLRALTQALRLWAWGNVACDLIVVNAEPTSYLMALQRDVAALREQFPAAAGGVVGFHLLRADDLGAAELATLRLLARVHFNADGRPLTHHVQEWSEAHEAALEERQTGAVAVLLPATGLGARPRVSQGRFVDEGRGFRFEASMFERPQRPWVNVLANEHFGTQVSEAGGGYSWALNSRLNQLTPWSNDVLADPPGEWLLLQDLRSRALWSVGASAWADPTATYRVTHGQGQTRVEHRRGDLDVSATWCVDAQHALKQVQLRVVNRGRRTQRLRAIGIAEWVMGGSRAERAGTDTASFTQRLPAAGDDAGARRLIALTCTQRDNSAGFGGGTAFFALADSTDAAPDWTCDRRECFDARGRLIVPDEFDQRAGPGLDPCAALSTTLVVAPGEAAQCVFLLGYAATLGDARGLATSAAAESPDERLDQVRAHWDKLLGASAVKTPDPLFDALVNRWLLYQTVACRMWARAGFYQAGGAFGFRDQLQDAMALAWAAPALLRRQIVLNASRQFPEGDVQHWWHAPTGAGVRTHFCDDLLWLPHACAHYVQSTGDASVLDEQVAFIEGGPIPDGAEDAYYVPSESAERASVFEHAARTIDRSLRNGVHGLPLMGSGDWNDGMNRVGAEGRGESVWLAWFLCQIVAVYAPIARGRGETARAQRWEEAARGWRAALQDDAWDGQWYRRAFFDDGTPLGSTVNRECRIDLIAQAWSVISDTATPAFRRMAMSALDTHLVDREAGLIKLLTPALQTQQPGAGYIQAYPPGVRENGGQYSHAGVWALIAQAMQGDGDAAYRYFTYLSPAHRSADPTRAPAYAIEPYVMAGDVYAEAPYVGRGGWSWYTGSAGWMHRAAIEHLFGVRRRGDSLSFHPCLPSHWPRAELTLRREGRTLHVVFARTGAAAPPNTRRVAAGETIDWRALIATQTICVLLEAPAEALVAH
ncbi:MAG TPA: glucoamylase family protein [Burkholderiaceae bacterium]|nr:glucoamylase family protein [Burkholderiaceae bacterium]